MTLKPSHLALYCLLGIICVLIGYIIARYNSYESKLAWWKQYARGCNAVSQRQDEIIKGFLR